MCFASPKYRTQIEHILDRQAILWWYVVYVIRATHNNSTTYHGHWRPLFRLVQHRRSSWTAVHLLIDLDGVPVSPTAHLCSPYHLHTAHTPTQYYNITMVIYHSCCTDEHHPFFWNWRGYIGIIFIHLFFFTIFGGSRWGCSWRVPRPLLWVWILLFWHTIFQIVTVSDVDKPLPKDWSQKVFGTPPPSVNPPLLNQACCVCNLIKQAKNVL